MTTFEESLSEGEAPPLEELEKEIGYTFRDRSLLELAMTHESYANERRLPSGSNERLEFLGDAVVGLVVSRYLYERHPRLAEGRLAQMKAHLVSASYLAEQARQLDLGRFLRLGRGEATSTGRNRRNLLADAFEALVGALYLDGGMEAAQPFVLRHFREAVDRMEGLRKDFKSLLQEHTQKHFKTLPLYEVMDESGPPHQRIFTVRVYFGDQILGEGTGRSKREAGQEAARQALEKLKALEEEITEEMESGPSLSAVPGEEALEGDTTTSGHLPDS
jgi:ribonuclease-3